MASALRQYLDLYCAEQQHIAAYSPAILNAPRQAALEMLERHGLPTFQTEDYRYTNVAEALAPDYGLNLRRILPPSNLARTYRCSVPDIGAFSLHVLNDTSLPIVPDTTFQNAGIEVLDFHQYAKKKSDFIAKHYHTLAPLHFDALTALNTLFVQDGLCLYLPKNTRAEKPIQIVYSIDSPHSMMSNRRLLVIAEDGAEASILLCEHASASTKQLTTQVTEIFIGSGAKIDLCTIEETSATCTRFHNIYADVATNGLLTLNGVTLTAGNSRQRTNINLNGSGAQVEINGAVTADDNERIDQHVLVRHNVENCQSTLRYKYVLDGSSTGAFTGKVLVAEGAQNSFSEQTHANLCVSPTAHAFSQPMLEIYADDVRCNHGATVGKFDETALFYMRQRGVPEKQARLLLQHAFIYDVLQHIQSEALRQRLSVLVEKRFRGELRHCDGCQMHLREPSVTSKEPSPSHE